MNNLTLKIRILPRWIIILIDLSFLFFTSLLAYLLRFNFDYSRLEDFQVNKGVFLFVLFGLVAELVTRCYAGIVRYTGLQDTGRVSLMVAIASGLMVVANMVNHYVYGTNIMPYSVLIIAFLGSVFFLISYRLGVKELFGFFWKTGVKPYNVAIYGSSKLSQITRQIIENDIKNNRKVVAFFDEHRHKVGKVMNGIRIYNGHRDLPKMIFGHGLQELIIVDRDLSIERKNELVDLCLRANVKVMMVPPVEHWINGQLRLNQIKDIDIEELLERDSIKLENYNIRTALKGKRVLVTGAAGSIGSEIVRQVLYYRPAQVIMLDQAESPLFEVDQEIMHKKGMLKVVPVIGDITNESRMEDVFKEFAPDVVYHSAAYKHVPIMEINPAEAVICNVKGTRILADLAVKYKTEKFVMISTDKAVNPSSVMGASKRIAEMYVQSLNNYLHENNPEHTRFITTRFGNVLGSNGSVIPLFKKQIEQGGPITVTHPEITRYFMTIPEACQLVLEAGAMGKGGEIFVFDMGKSMKIVDLAYKMIQLSGLEPEKDIEIVYTGLRDGEKLYEELLSNYENSMPTYHHKIMISKTREECYETARDKIENLINVAYDDDDLKLVGIMKYIVPEFRSMSSKYEALDKPVFSAKEDQEKKDKISK
jgi:FlaA1/EpsC-like NDP-sugar epimerase